MMLALKGECLWNHYSNSTNLTDFAEKILNWLVKNAQVKALIDQKISSIIENQLNNTQTAHEQWNILSEYYS